MSLDWSVALQSLAVVAALTAGYVVLVRRRADAAAALAAAGLAPARGTGWRRHVPIGLSLAALAVLGIALARPEAALGLPRREGTIMVAIDVSASMSADDVDPNRLEVAKGAARHLVTAQPSSIDVGVVAFGDGALLAQGPTDDRGAVLDAIDRLDALGSTSVADGIFAALNAVTDEPLGAELALDAGITDGPGTGAEGPVGPGGEAADDTGPDGASPAIGYVGSAAIVVISDGELTDETDPLAVAELASTAGVPVSTVGVGTAEGAVVEVDGFSVATALDADLLAAIADTAGGTFALAGPTGDGDVGGDSGGSLDALDDLADGIDRRWTTDAETIEVTAIAAMVAIALLLAAAAASMRWTGRVA